MKQFTLIIIVTLNLLLSNLVIAQAPEERAFAVATWVERDSAEFLIIARFCQELATTDKQAVWSTPIIIHRSKKPLTSSNLITLGDGTQLLFWSEQDKAKSSIKYKAKAPTSTTWGRSLNLYNQGTENIGVNLLRQNQTIWSFWASTDAQLPDIRYSVFANGEWLKSERLHPTNSVPDIQPIAHFNKDNELVVDWLSYSFLQSNYIPAQKKLSNGFDKTKHIDIIDVDEFELPDFLPFDQAVTLRFPRNHFKQSRIVTSPILQSTQ